MKKGLRGQLTVWEGCGRAHGRGEGGLHLAKIEHSGRWGIKGVLEARRTTYGCQARQLGPPCHALTASISAWMRAVQALLATPEAGGRSQACDRHAEAEWGMLFSPWWQPVLASLVSRNKLGHLPSHLTETKHDRILLSSICHRCIYHMTYMAHASHLAKTTPSVGWNPNFHTYLPR